MNIEFERKFLVSPENFDRFVKTNCYSCVVIKQGYLMSDTEKCVRIRLVDDDKAYLTYKERVGIGKCIEIESQVEYNTASAFYEVCTDKLEKVRRLVKTTAGIFVEVDLFKNGMILAEVELKGEEDSEFLTNNMPEWFSDEVTGIHYYSNTALAKLEDLK